ncbi:MAG: hypothetical protein EAX86_01200 [Candidatus Heimdallarchaeota archaeon]|nr:hypothetical protein [Candidatus Heimdallarchaeota archaeon]
MKSFKKNYIESESNLPKSRLTGRICEIQYNNNLFKGEILSETKNTLEIQTPRGIKILPKTESTIKIKIKDQYYQINGTQLIGRHEDRIKKRMKRKW